MAKKKRMPEEQTRLIATTHNNHYLFSDYYLNELVIETEEWEKGDGIEKAFGEISELYNKIKATIEKANESQTEERFIKPVLEILGHYIEVQTKAPQIDHAKRPDYAFFADEKTKEKAFAEIGSKDYFNYVMAVGDAKSWNRPLDKKIKTHRGDPFNNANPNFQMDYYLRITNKQWGILTNGPKWRLYNRDVSYLLDHYFEVDLVELLDQGKIDEFKYFYLFFRRDALVKDAFLDKAYKQSKDYAVGVEENLKDRVYEALLRLAKGFWEYDGNKFTENDLKAIHDNCLIVLYQLLFVLNAECRGLLPLQNNTYAGTYSLKGISKEIVGKLESKTELLPNTNHYWSKLFSLFKLIYQGEKHLGITFFDGSLFDFNQHEFLNKYSIGDKHLVEAIDYLCRAKTKKGLAPIDYRDLEIRHLGGIYEGILEYKLQLAREDMVVYKEKGKEKYLPLSEAKKARAKYKPDDVIKKGEIYLTTDKGERKATGSYFTPKYIVNYIVENTLGPLVEGKKPKEILELNVLDPAMGSGHFLLGATDYLARAIHEKEAHGELLSEEVDDEINDIRRHVVERCVNGVDINPLAVELAKLTLWLHTMSKGKPLNFLDHNLKCGNSLIGAKLSDLERLPVLKKKKEKAISMKLPGIDAFFSSYKHDLGPILDWIIKIEYKTTDSPDDIKTKKHAFEYVEKTTEKYRRVADLWISKYFGSEFDQGIYQDAVDYVLKGKSQLPERKIKEYFHKAQELKKEKKFFNWELEFPEVFFDKYGRNLDSPGFDAVIGNPPYIEVKKISDDEKEYLRNSSIHNNAEILHGRYDIFWGFYKKGLDILKENCILGLLTSNSFLEAVTAENLRYLLIGENTLFELIDCGKFSKEVGVYVVISLIKKKAIKKYTLRVKKEIDDPNPLYIDNKEILSQRNYLIKFTFDKSSLSFINKTEKNTVNLCKLMYLQQGIIVQSKIHRRNHYVKESQTGSYKPYIEGKDVERYEYPLKHRYLDYKPHEHHRPRIEEVFKGTKLLVKRITKGIKGIVDEGYYYTDNTLYTGTFYRDMVSYKERYSRQLTFGNEEINESKNYNYYYILSIINSKLITYYNNIKFGVFSLDTLNQFPVRRINFTTPKEERERLVEELKGLYGNAETKGILSGIDECLPKDKSGNFITEKEKTDVAHDFLAFLAEQMIEMNKEKQKESKSFLEWLEREIGAKVEDLPGKTIIKEYYKEENNIDKLIDVLKKNKAKISIDPGRREFQDRLKEEYDKSLAKLGPLLQKIKDTDNSIDQIVYKLYGLTEEKIK